MKTRGKNKDTGGKLKTGGKNIDRGKNIIYFPPVEILSSNIVTKKDCVQRKKYDLISLLQYFPPSTESCESRKIIAWPKGEKIKTLGEKISYIFPQLDFCALFSVTIKIIGGKI